MRRAKVERGWWVFIFPTGYIAHTTFSYTYREAVQLYRPWSGEPAGVFDNSSEAYHFAKWLADLTGQAIW